MEKKNASVQVSRVAGIKKNVVLASAVAAALGAMGGQAIAASHEAAAVMIASDKSTLSDRAAAGAGAMLKLWAVDASGNPHTLDADTVITLDSSNEAVIPDSSVTLPASGMTMIDLGGVSPDVAVAGQGNTTLSAVMGSPSTMPGTSVDLNVVDDFLQGTIQFANGTSTNTVMQAFDVTDAAGTPFTGPVRVTHYDGGIGSTPLEAVPDTAVTNNNGTLSLAFTQATGTVTTASNEYYVLSSAGFGDAVVANAGNDATPDLVAGDPEILKASLDVANGFSVVAPQPAYVATGGVAVDGAPRQAQAQGVPLAGNVDIKLSMGVAPEHVGQTGKWFGLLYIEVPIPGATSVALWWDMGANAEWMGTPPGALPGAPTTFDGQVRDLLTFSGVIADVPPNTILFPIYGYEIDGSNVWHLGGTSAEYAAQ